MLIPHDFFIMLQREKQVKINHSKKAEHTISANDYYSNFSLFINYLQKKTCINHKKC